MLDDVYEDLKSHFEKTYDAMRRDLARVRTGRANINILDGIRVNYYGQPTPLNQVAALQVPEPRMIVIKPWDAGVLKDLERALLQSDVGLNPTNDGHIIRLAIPPLTEERRKEFVKLVNKQGEDGKVAIRNSRREANAMLKSLQKDGDITEDDLQRGLKEVQTLTDDAVKSIDGMVAAKEKELMEF